MVLTRRFSRFDSSSITGRELGELINIHYTALLFSCSFVQTADKLRLPSNAILKTSSNSYKLPPNLSVSALDQFKTREFRFTFRSIQEPKLSGDPSASQWSNSSRCGQHNRSRNRTSSRTSHQSSYRTSQTSVNRFFPTLKTKNLAIRAEAFPLSLFASLSTGENSQHSLDVSDDEPIKLSVVVIDVGRLSNLFEAKNRGVADQLEPPFQSASLSPSLSLLPFTFPRHTSTRQYVSTHSHSS